MIFLYWIKHTAFWVGFSFPILLNCGEWVAIGGPLLILENICECGLVGTAIFGDVANVRNGSSVCETVCCELEEK